MSLLLRAMQGDGGTEIQRAGVTSSYGFESVEFTSSISSNGLEASSDLDQADASTVRQCVGLDAASSLEVSIGSRAISAYVLDISSCALTGFGSTTFSSVGVGLVDSISSLTSIGVVGTSRSATSNASSYLAGTPVSGTASQGISISNGVTTGSCSLGSSRIGISFANADTALGFGSISISRSCTSNSFGSSNVGSNRTISGVGLNALEEIFYGSGEVTTFASGLEISSGGSSLIGVHASSIYSIGNCNDTSGSSTASFGLVTIVRGAVTPESASTISSGDTSLDVAALSVSDSIASALGILSINSSLKVSIQGTSTVGATLLSSAPVLGISNGYTNVNSSLSILKSIESTSSGSSSTSSSDLNSITSLVSAIHGESSSTAFLNVELEFNCASYGSSNAHGTLSIAGLGIGPAVSKGRVRVHSNLTVIHLDSSHSKKNSSSFSVRTIHDNSTKTR